MYLFSHSYVFLQQLNFEVSWCSEPFMIFYFFFILNPIKFFSFSLNKIPLSLFIYLKIPHQKLSFTIIIPANVDYHSLEVSLRFLASFFFQDLIVLLVFWSHKIIAKIYLQQSLTIDFSPWFAFCIKLVDFKCGLSR